MTRDEAEELIRQGQYLVGKTVTVREINRITYKYDTSEYVVQELKLNCSADISGNFRNNEVCSALAVLRGVRDSQVVLEGLRGLILNNPPGSYK